MQALQGIASHPVNLDFARAAAAPISSRQLAQAWLAFQAAVSRSSAAADGLEATAQAAKTPTPGAVTNAVAGGEGAATAAEPNGSKAAEAEARTASKQADLTDEGDDEEVLAPFPCCTCCLLSCADQMSFD